MNLVYHETMCRSRGISLIGLSNVLLGISLFQKGYLKDRYTLRSMQRGVQRAKFLRIFLKGFLELPINKGVSEAKTKRYTDTTNI